MTDNFTGVRIAKPGDEEAIFNLMVMANQENGQYHMNPTKVLDFIKKATQGNGAIIGVIDGQNGIEASVGLVLQQWWYTDEWSLGERWNFVHPNHRKTIHAKKLIEFSKWCAKSMNFSLEMGVISNDRTEAKVRLYRRQMPCVGAFFMYKAR